MRVYQFRHFGKQAANLIAIFLLAKFISNKVEKSDINFLFITFISFEQLITMKNLGVFIGLVFFSMISYSQMTMALMKELVVQDGVHYLKGVEFSGIAFKKNEKGKFITEEPFKKGLLHGKRINYNTSGSPIAREKFKKGKGVYLTYHSNNRLKSKGLIDKGVKYGEWIYYNRKGVLKAKELWSEEIPGQLEWEKYYNKKGGIKSEMYYKSGLLSKEV